MPVGQYLEGGSIFAKKQIVTPGVLSGLGVPTAQPHSGKGTRTKMDPDFQLPRRFRSQVRISQGQIVVFENGRTDEIPEVELRHRSA